MLHDVAITYIDDACNMPLNRNAAQHQIDLVVIVTITLQILDDSQAGLAVCNSGIHVVLLAILIDGETL